MYYADTTIYRDRIDIIEQNRISIIDFKNERFYDIVKRRILILFLIYKIILTIYIYLCSETCSWMQIPGKILPLLWFPTYEYLGNSTHNKVLCHQWAGCHDYEVIYKPSITKTATNVYFPIYFSDTSSTILLLCNSKR